VKEKTSIPLIQVMAKVVTPFNRSESRRAEHPKITINTSNSRTNFPDKIIVQYIVYYYEALQTSLKPTPMLLIGRWICFYPGQ